MWGEPIIVFQANVRNGRRLTLAIDADRVILARTASCRTDLVQYLTLPMNMKCVIAPDIALAIMFAAEHSMPCESPELAEPRGISEQDIDGLAMY